MREVVKLPLMLTGGFRTAGAMVEAIESGAVDIIGLGRPMALEPDLPKRILSGEVASADDTRACPNFVCPSSSLWNHEASFTRFRKASTSLRCSSVNSTNRYQVWIWAHALSRTMPSA
jgi:hypothetical protein